MLRFWGACLFVVGLFLVCGDAASFELHDAKMDANVTLQGQRFNGDSFDTFGGYADGPVSKYSLRHATIGLTGGVGQYMEFEFRAGSATCLSGGQFTLMDASVLYAALPWLKFGIKKGEIMRGFEFHEECVEVLTAEKPRFSKTWAPCHPMGGVVEIEHAFDENMGISAQVAYLGGATEDLDNEHDANIGIQFRTPLQGFAIGGFFASIRKSYGPGPDFQPVMDSGNRWGIGFNYEDFNVHLRSEFYGLTGFYNNPFSNTYYENNSDTTTYIESKDLEMGAWYAEAGYTFTTGWQSIPFVQPFLRYQSWDKASNADGDHVYTYYTCGVTLFTDQEKHTLIKIDFEECLDCPDYQEKDAALLIVRMQIDMEVLLQNK